MATPSFWIVPGGCIDESQTELCKCFGSKDIADWTKDTKHAAAISPQSSPFLGQSGDFRFYNSFLIFHGYNSNGISL